MLSARAAAPLSVVTVTHDSAAVLEQMLRSVREQLPASTQVVVVDTGSGDDGPEIARAHGAELVLIDGNPGFGAANNRALQLVVNDVCLLLNPDLVLLDDGMLRLAAAARERDALHVPVLLNPDGSVQDSAHPLPGRRREYVPALVPPSLLPPRLREAFEPYRARTGRQVGWAIAAAIAARTETLRELGPFDPRNFLFNEDLELCLRAAATGRPTLLHPDVQIVHAARHATKRLGARIFDLEATSRRRVVGQALGRRALARDDLAQGMTFASRALARRLLGRPADRPRAQLAALRRARRAAAPLPVLLLSHTSMIGGGERSILELVDSLDHHVRLVARVPPGPLAVALAARGVRVLELRGTKVALGSIGGAVRGVPVLILDGLRAARTVRAERVALVYAISVRAGLVAAVARRVTAAPAVVFVQDLLGDGRGTDAVRLILHHGTDRRQACSQAVAARLGTAADVVFESLDADRHDPGRWTRAAARTAVGLPDGPVLVLVGQVTPWKGQLEAVRALPAVRAAVPGTRLVLVGPLTAVPGDRRYDNHAYMGELQAAIEALGLRDSVAWWGRREDVPAIMRGADVVLMPSWEEPFGRVAVEAMAMETPVVATRAGGPAEYVREGETGLLVPPRDPTAIATAAVALLERPEWARAIGRRASVEVRGRFGRDSAGADRFATAVTRSWSAALSADRSA